MENIKKLRLENNATQKFCAELLGVSLRSYIDYENNKEKQNTIKYEYMLKKLQDYFLISEDKGVVTIDYIKQKTKDVLYKYNVDYCYLFGSYAKGKAKENSDIDLLVSCDSRGLKFFELAEELRQVLHKRIDLLDVQQINNNQVLLNEILKDGVKIYG